ncbi:MAG: flagellar motor switch protein FliN [Bryobacteraceae bacterium]
MQPGNLEWLTQTLAQHLAEALELMTGEAPQVAWTTAAASAAPQGASWCQQGFSVSPEAQLWIGAPETSWREIGVHVLRAAGIEPGAEAEIKNTYQEILGQAFASLARSLATRLNREVAVEDGTEAPPPETVPAQAIVDLTLAGGAPVSLWLAFSQPLLDALEPHAERPVPGKPIEEGEREAPAAELPAPPDAPGPPRSATGGRTLDLLLEVEMPVSISFGRTQLPLRDLLKLTTGSIIELNRTVNEPVEVIVNNCVIARGEVVVLEGNYGIRIQQIISRQERLRTLK